MKPPVNYEAEYCGRVPLHQTNLIQPHGVLLIVDREDRGILQASENADGLFGSPVSEIVGRRLDDFLPAEQVGSFAARYSQAMGKLPFTFRFPSGTYLGIVLVTDNYFIIEIEKQPRSGVSDETFVAIYQELRFAMSAVEKAETTVEAAEIAIRELKKLSGFDKVMMYQFDEDWCGDVIAEVREEEMDAYLGLKFPASDIPKQARDLYKRTPYRLIPTVDYEPVRLFPVLNPKTNAFTDLSDSNLRSVAGVHLEYLRNMGVNASMSTRVLVDGELWGLIACHHRTPKYLSFELCAVFELLSQVISSRITTVQQRDSFARRQDLTQLQHQVAEEVLKTGDVPASLHNQQEELLRLLSADGAALFSNGRIHSFGATPDDSSLADLAFWLCSQQPDRVVQQTQLSAVYEPAEKFADTASGLLAMSLHPDGRHCLLAFRPEAVQKVTWAGNPAEAIRFEADRKNYHPRNSFRIWQQTVHKTSLPWKKEELEQAELFRRFLHQYLANS